MFEFGMVKLYYFIIDRDHLLSSTVRGIGVRAKGVFFLLRNIGKIDQTFISVRAIHGIRPIRVRGTEV
jgi:hypothetical protein